MRDACLVGAAILAGAVVLSGCGSDDGKPDQPSSTAGAGARSGTKAPADGKGTVIERAAGTWKTILSGSDIDTLTVKEGHVTAKGGQLDCEGTLEPGTRDGEESPSLTLFCKGGTDGGRGLGHLSLKDAKNDALAIDWDGAKGGAGGQVDSFRRTG